MKSCPTCNRTYPDDTLAFCLMDGSVLSAPYDPSDSQRRPSPRGSSAPATEVLIAPTVAAAEQPYLQSTIHAPAPQFIPSPQSVGTGQITDRVGTGCWLMRAAFVLRGLAAIIMTIAFFLLLGSLNTFFALLGAHLFISGALAMMASIGSHIEYKRGAWLLLDAIASLLTGLCVLVMWFLGAGYEGFMMLLVLLPIWALISGVAEIGAAVHLRRYITGARLLTLAGVVSIICGLGVGIRYLSIAIPLAVNGIVCGVLLIILGLRLRSKAPAEQRS